MKAPHTSATTVITTPQQQQVIEDLENKHLEEGGSILAQVFHDGLRVRVLTPQQTQELAEHMAKALGQPVSGRFSHSVFDKGGAK